MYAAISPSDQGRDKRRPAVIAGTEPMPQHMDSVEPVRVSGGVSLTAEVDVRTGVSRVSDLGERDGYKVRFPRAYAHPEAIIINTGGGLASGDIVDHDFTVGDGAALTVTSQACERVYRKSGGNPSCVTTKATLGEGATLFWLPQETIFFDRANLHRRFDMRLEKSSQLFMTETIVFGRKAMDEVVTSGSFIDRWRIYRDGELVLAENARLDDAAFRQFGAKAVADGHHVMMTCLAVAPDVEDRLARIRTILPDGTNDQVKIAASGWNGLVVVRALAHSGEEVRKIMTRLIPALCDQQMPRVWLS